MFFRVKAVPQAEYDAFIQAQRVEAGLSAVPVVASPSVVVTPSIVVTPTLVPAVISPTASATTVVSASV
jgi:hypothetical protein